MDNAEIPPILLPEWFERQAAATPDAVAVSAPDTVMTYADLNARANRLARHLVALGAGPEHLVAVGMRRSGGLIVAFLAALKSGAAYLPVDLDNPPQRIAFMMGDARPVLAITTEADRHAVEGLDLRAVVLDDPKTLRLLADLSPDNVTDTDRRAPLLPGNPAYVIYTSGSTGTPKGVVIEHRALVAYLAYARAHYPSVRGRAVLHSSVAFDMSITTLYGPLVCGGSIEVSSLEELSVSPDFLKVAPSHLALLATLPDAAPTGDLVVGGEMLLGEVVTEFRQRHPNVTVINEYGPTEATVGCCAHFMRPGDSVQPGPVPIGAPTWTTEMYVLDERLRPVPAGEVGELYIGGGQLARGYLNRPGLTAERSFVANPFGPPGSRMYRTGDRGRRRADGNLEFLGRLDRQVKIRGYRIELGEIESVLLRHSDVRQVAVTVHAQCIIAYVVSADRSEFDERRLREHAAGSLPEYMVPGVIVELDTLPLNANGKLDTSALPVPRFDSDTPFRAPRTPEEKVLCDLFARYSGTKATVSVGDDFFAIGGTSLSAAQVVNEARKHGVVFTVRDLMTNRTVAALANKVGLSGD